MVNCILIWNQGYFLRHAAEYYECITEWMCVYAAFWGCSGLSTHTHKTYSSGGFGKWVLLRETLPSPWYHSELFKYAWQLWSLSSPQRTTCCSITPGVKDHLATILIYTDSHSLNFTLRVKAIPFYHHSCRHSLNTSFILPVPER